MLLKSVILTLLLVLSLDADIKSNKAYHKDYYTNGILKSQGWIEGVHKTGYWFFYRKNGLLEKEGHYRKDKMTNWWIFYDNNGLINHKCQLIGGKKNGYCLKYNNDKLSSAVKYANGKKIMEWYDLSSFKRDNKLSDLK